MNLMQIRSVKWNNLSNNVQGAFYRRQGVNLKVKIVVKQYLMLFISFITLSSCASVEEQNELGRDIDYSGSDCISIRTIRDYTPLDERTLIIEGAGRRNYLVTLQISTFELRSSHRIAFTSRDDWLCPYGGDEIIFGSFARHGAGIRSISKVTQEQLEELLIRYGKGDPGEEQGPEPKEIEGAEVEELG